MFPRANFDGHRSRHAEVPFELDILDSIRLEFVAPAWIDDVLTAHARIDQLTLFAKSGFFEQLAPCRRGMIFIMLQAAGHRLPEIEWLHAP